MAGSMNHVEQHVRVLGIETSCDETAAAVVTGARDVLAETILSQIDEHAEYGGVVPEIAARSHVEHLDGLIKKTLADAGLGLEDMDAIAVTAGPGLIGGVMVGVVTAKALAFAADKPLIAVNHLEGHALTARLTDNVAFPYLLLLVSGGHCQLLVVKGVGDYERMGTTIDDAVGEAFDKGAKLLGLGYPGGPAIEQAAKEGDATRFKLPRPLTGSAAQGLNFSFSGLKTALRREVEKLGEITDTDIADLCASYQAALRDCLTDRTTAAMEVFCGRFPDLEAPTLVVAGGVAANQAIRSALSEAAQEKGMRLVAPPPPLCTDNGAMIAWAGVERFRAGMIDDLDAPARPRWPLDDSATVTYGSGKKGAKV